MQVWLSARMLQYGFVNVWNELYAKLGFPWGNDAASGRLLVEGHYLPACTEPPLVGTISIEVKDIHTKVVDKTRAAFSEEDVSKTVELKNAKLKVDGVEWTVQWCQANPADCDGTIASVEAKVKGKIQLENGQEFENPIQMKTCGKGKFEADWTGLIEVKSRVRVQGGLMVFDIEAMKITMPKLVNSPMYTCSPAGKFIPGSLEFEFLTAPPTADELAATVALIVVPCVIPRIHAKVDNMIKERYLTGVVTTWDNTAARQAIMGLEPPKDCPFCMGRNGQVHGRGLYSHGMLLWPFLHGTKRAAAPQEEADGLHARHELQRREHDVRGRAHGWDT